MPEADLVALSLHPLEPPQTAALLAQLEMETTQSQILEEEEGEAVQILQVETAGRELSSSVIP